MAVSMANLNGLPAAAKIVKDGISLTVGFQYDDSIVSIVVGWDAMINAIESDATDFLTAV